MADKEATVYIVDLGATMAETHGGRSESNLDWAMRYVWDKISATVAASRKTWKVGVLGLRTDATSNSLQDDEGYDNIAVLQSIDAMSLTALRTLCPKIKPSKTINGDAVSAIIVAVEMISAAAPARLKFSRKIVLVTDGRGAIDGDDFDDLAQRINELGINLVIIGVDFDDAEYGFKEEEKPKIKAQNEKLLSTLVGKCNDGVLGTLAEAIDEIQKPNVKVTRPYKTYDGPLTLGDPKTFDGALSINIERYFLTKSASPPSATTVIVRSGSAEDGTQSTHTVGGTEDVEMANADFAAVKNERVYTVDDPTRLGGKREVEFEDLDKGYEYGRTAVHISTSDANITQLQTEKGFSILGFVTRANNKAQPYLNMGESCIIMPQRFSEQDELAFSSLVHAMVDTDTCAVARLVAKDMKDPVMLLLLPTVTSEHVCLYDVPLPFAEDVRSYPFPPLDKVITASGAVLTKHRLLPTDDLNQAMSDYVDAMDISMFGTDDDGQPTEYADLEENYSPIIYRVNKAISFRATHPTEPYVQRDSEFTTRFDHPPEELVESAKSQIAALIRAADVKKVPPKPKGRAGRDANKNKPISGLDIDALLGGGGGNFGGGRGPVIKKEGDELRKISPYNAIPEFKQALASTVSVKQIEGFTEQMGQITESLITSSTGDFNYSRAAENLRVMREELISLEEPAIYNAFITGFKVRLIAEKLGGPRLDMWWAVRTSGLGLITSNESDQSTVTEDDAKESFWPAMAQSMFCERVLAAYDLDDVEPGLVDGGLTSSPSSPLPGTETRDSSKGTLSASTNPTEYSTDTKINSIRVPFDPEDQSDDEVVIASAYKRSTQGGKRLPKGHGNSEAEQGKVYPGRRVSFCPWRIVENYHSWFVGKQNSARIGPYFKKAELLKCQPWDFCYVWHPDKEKAGTYVLVVPTSQFQHLLDRINETLHIQLVIPPGTFGEKFTVIFGQQKTPIPRFLGCAGDVSAFDALVKSIPPPDPADAVFGKPKMEPKAAQMYTKKVDKLLYEHGKDEDRKKKSEKNRTKRLLNRRAAGRQIKRVAMANAGLEQGAPRGGTPFNIPDVSDDLRPPPFPQEKDVVFVAMDIESYEFNHGAITEIGFGILDSRDLAGLPPGLNCQNWLARIRGRHLRILEHASMVNRRHVHGCEENFNFGQSEFVSLRGILGVVTSILQPRLPSGEKRHVVLVGHDIRSDISLLKNIGLHVTDDMFLEIVDTQDFHQHLRMSAQQAGLKFVLADLEIEHYFLHNGGNDAVYTLQAMIRLAVKKRQDSLRRHQERLLPGYTPDAAITEEGWESGGEVSDGGPQKPEWDASYAGHSGLLSSCRPTSEKKALKQSTTHTTPPPNGHASATPAPTFAESEDLIDL
ncbi:ATP-dependent DNA helicase yku80 [Sporothrix curviconia]|uniref:ATP-dependent DNA helicase II subunit 2 n=1 Tax=Sporothrix curviconia TaxID=1260050 RepID=A0ABP0CDU7_9PEZI